MAKIRISWIFVLVLSGLALNARAHDVPSSAVLLDIGRTAVYAELQLPLSELGLALAQPLSAAPAQAVPKFGDRISDYVVRHIRINAPDGRAYTPTVQSLTLRRTDNRNWTSNDWLDVRLRMQAPSGAFTEVFTFDYDVIVSSVVNHNAFVSVRRDFRHALLGNQPQMIGLIAYQQTHLKVDGSGGSWTQGLQKVFWLGMRHIAEGTDHLLFLLALLLSAARTSLWNIVKAVSGFTLGHSLTLAIGALGLVSVPSRWVEILIALSIIVTAIHAWRPLFAGQEIYLAAGFGLIHGLAFATALSGLSDDAWTFGMSLLGFNLGIEAMQLMVIVALLPALLLLRRIARFRADRARRHDAGAHRWPLDGSERVY